MDYVSAVDVRKITGGGNLKAFVDVKIGDLIVKGFSILVTGSKGAKCIAFPRKAGRDGRWFDVVIPAEDALKVEIERVVMDAYEREAL
jgi:DNA-binding cell septation regulator SpoVG